MNSYPIKIAIIIVTYNDKKLIDACLRSVLNSKTWWSFDVWVIDNGSEDGTVEFIQENYPEVIVVRNQANFGYPYSNNLGITSTQSEYILLLNPDTVIPENALKDAISQMDQDQNIGVIGPKLIRPNGKMDFACRRMFPNYLDYLLLLLGLARKFPKNKILGHYNLTYLDPDETVDVDSVAGAFLLARRVAVEKIGLLDETFFIYGDDIDWCYRFKLNGWRVIYYPKIIVLHHKGGTSRRYSQYLIYHFYRSNTILYNKYIAGHTFFILNLIMYIAIWVKFLESFIYNSFLPLEKKRVA